MNEARVGVTHNSHPDRRRLLYSTRSGTGKRRAFACRYPGVHGYLSSAQHTGPARHTATAGVPQRFSENGLRGSNMTTRGKTLTMAGQHPQDGRATQRRRLTPPRRQGDTSQQGNIPTKTARQHRHATPNNGKRAGQHPYLQWQGNTHTTARQHCNIPTTAGATRPRRAGQQPQDGSATPV